MNIFTNKAISQSILYIFLFCFLGPYSRTPMNTFQALESEKTDMWPCYLLTLNGLHKGCWIWRLPYLVCIWLTLTISDRPSSFPTPMYVFSPNVERPSHPSHSCRNDSQATNHKLPLVTYELLPKSPGLANARSINGPIVYFRVLAFPLPMKDALKWA